jgi:predicted secreted hydrolase
MFHYPTDWPDDGPIDLAIHDLPHASSTIEWWYVNTHFETVDGKPYSIFASFFRRVVGQDKETKQPQYAHSVIWAISDVEAHRYYSDSQVDSHAPEIIIDILDNDKRDDTLVERALREVLQKRTLPSPDRLMTSPVHVSFERLELSFADNCFYKQDDGSYRLELFHDERQFGCNLLFQPCIPAIRHGKHGVVRGISNEGMFYYFVPRCHVEGYLLVNNEAIALKRANGWYDHEFGKQAGAIQQGDTEDNVAWNWISAQLDNGYQVSVYDLYNTTRGEQAGRWAIVVDAEGNQAGYTEFIFEPLENWTSSRTFSKYPICWKLCICQANIDLVAEAAFPDQEFLTIISKPAFWEGRVHLSGTINGHSVKGLAFVERSGFETTDQIEDFFAAVGERTCQSVEKLLPLDPTPEQLTRLIGPRRHAHYLDGINVEQYSRTIVQPLREIVDRG